MSEPRKLPTLTLQQIILMNFGFFGIQYSFGLQQTAINPIFSFLNANPELVKNFVNATNRGWEYALNHQEEIINLILKKYNTQHKSKEHLFFEAEQTKKI